MRIVLHDYGAYAFSVQLARSLATRGHGVTYLYAEGMNTPRGQVEPGPGDPAGLVFRGLAIGGRFERRAGVRRLLRERR